ncbi:hypothetical protein [Streptomyces avicenniae]|uniref:hypothetical protein n=1 Tax=Streptomyces avicenniae TaxID=500153 RepID=UPI00167D236E|nr:hypothetical protein [Streptomyces avicenniae]
MTEGDGGSGGPAESYRVLSVDDARAEVRELSSSVLDLTGLEGTFSEPGPGVSTCEEDPRKERLYLVRHIWSVSGLPERELTAGMDRLREQLPGEGWEIVEDGFRDNPARTPRFIADNHAAGYGVNVEFIRAYEDSEPMLSVTLVSGCLSTPEGESPRGEY